MLQKMNGILDRFNVVPGATTHASGGNDIAAVDSFERVVASGRLPSQLPPSGTVQASTALVKVIRRAQSVQKVRRDSHLAVAASRVKPEVDKLRGGGDPARTASAFYGSRAVGDATPGVGIAINSASHAALPTTTSCSHLAVAAYVDFASGDSSFQALKTYGRDLVEEAGKLDPVVEQDLAFGMPTTCWTKGPDHATSVPVPICLTANKKIIRKLPYTKTLLKKHDKDLVSHWLEDMEADKANVAASTLLSHNTTIDIDQASTSLLPATTSALMSTLTPVASSEQDHVSDAPTTCSILGPCIDADTGRAAVTSQLAIEMLPSAFAALSVEAEVPSDLSIMFLTQGSSHDIIAFLYPEVISLSASQSCSIGYWQCRYINSSCHSRLVGVILFGFVNATEFLADHKLLELCLSRIGEVFSYGAEVWQPWPPPNPLQIPRIITCYHRVFDRGKFIQSLSCPLQQTNFVKDAVLLSLYMMEWVRYCSGHLHFGNEDEFIWTPSRLSVSCDNLLEFLEVILVIDTEIVWKPAQFSEAMLTYIMDHNLDDADLLSFYKAVQSISLFCWRSAKAMDQYPQFVPALWDPGGYILQFTHSETLQLNYSFIIVLQILLKNMLLSACAFVCGPGAHSKQVESLLIPMMMRNACSCFLSDIFGVTFQLAVLHSNNFLTVWLHWCNTAFDNAPNASQLQLEPPRDSEWWCYTMQKFGAYKGLHLQGATHIKFASGSTSTVYSELFIQDETKFTVEPSLNCYQPREEQWDCNALKFAEASCMTLALLLPHWNSRAPCWLNLPSPISSGHQTVICIINQQAPLNLGDFKSGLGASRISSGGECHVLDCCVGCGQGLGLIAVGLCMGNSWLSAQATQRLQVDNSGIERRHRTE